MMTGCKFNEYLHTASDAYLKSEFQLQHGYAKFRYNKTICEHICRHATMHYLFNVKHDKGNRVQSEVVINFCRSGMLGSVDWQLVTDIQGQPVVPIFKGRETSFTVKTGPIGCPKTSVAQCRCCVRQLPRKAKTSFATQQELQTPNNNKIHPVSKVSVQHTSIILEVVCQNRIGPSTKILKRLWQIEVVHRYLKRSWFAVLITCCTEVTERRHKD